MNERIWKPITKKHLEILKEEALNELNRFINEVGKGKYSVYEDKLVAICLCQGVAQHFFELWLMEKEPEDIVIEVTQEEIKAKSLKIKNKLVLSGIKDIDIWLFFEEHPKIKIPHRRNMRKSVVLELPDLGRRRIDFMKKMIPIAITKDATTKEETIRKYLTLETNTAKFLRKKSIIGLYPPKLFGKPIWKVKRITPKHPL
ncbi:MAG: hypothetical protein ABGX27_03400 [Desulfurobacteriaceae bacterium]